MRLVFLAVAPILSVLLAACEPTEVASPPEASQETAPTDAATADVAGAETFARDLYANIFNEGLAPLDDANRALWSQAAWAELEAAWAEDPGAITVDPLCSCQDPYGMALQDVSVGVADEGRVDAAVVLSRPDGQTSLTLNLVHEDGAWRIDDVSSEGDPSFRQALAAGEA